MKFIFVRHGESQANAAYLLADAYSPLTNKGKVQAKATAQAIQNFGVTKIVCSTMLRARQTAMIIAAELNLNANDTVVIDELRERGMGELENTVKQYEGPHYYTLDEPASLEQRLALLMRMEQALELITKFADKEVLLIVGHACSGFYLRQVAAGHTTLESFDPPEQIDNAGYAIVEIK